MKSSDAIHVLLISSSRISKSTARDAITSSIAESPEHATEKTVNQNRERVEFIVFHGAFNAYRLCLIMVQKSQGRKDVLVQNAMCIDSITQTPDICK